MSAEASRILFCDYDGDFEFASQLSQVGFAIDQIRPDALRQVAVGDHQVFLFSFGQPDSLMKVLKTCEKLKYAELSTPLLLLARTPMGPEFLNHQKSKFAANSYVSNPTSEAMLLDALDALVGCPMPPHLKSARMFSSDSSQVEQLAEKLKDRVTELEAEILRLKDKLSESDQPREDSWRPKLKALLEGQKLQFQTESERLQVQLSEVEAKLLDREMRIKDLEVLTEKAKKKLEETASQHEKAQETLRSFYMTKLKSLEQEKKDLEQKLAQTG